nr:hypothetical protein [Salmonella enterica]
MDKAAAPGLAHLAAEDLRAEKIAGQIDRKRRIPFGQRQRVEPTRAQDGRGVDEDAAWAERLFGRLRRRGHAFDVRGVAGGHHGLFQYS